MRGSDIARLNNSESAAQGLTYDGSNITWLRGGTSPEVWRTTFEHTTDGSHWTRLGVGTRIPGGWQLTGVPLPSGGTIRARGYVAGDASNWFVETVLGPLFHLSEPVFGNGVFQASSPTIAGRTYVLEYKDTLTATNWLALPGLAGDGTVQVLTDTNALTPQRFYRVRVNLP